MTVLRKFRYGRALLLPLAVIALAAAIACSSDDDDDSTPGSGGAAATAPAGATVAVGVRSGDVGKYLTGPEGRTLYVFLRDEPNKTNCSGGCLQTWPPLLLKNGESVKGDADAKGSFASIDTPSGKQVTYNGAPLYYFVTDTQPGETKGDLVGNVWFVARPESASTSVVGVRSEGDKTPYLVGPTGKTLYLFARDTEGVSNCSGTCLENWPALAVPEGLEPSAVSGASGALGVFTRDDGARQVTYKGLPLYYFAADKLPGETTGDGVGGVWTLAKP
jgi:predicted lipoprotein with Yx(FWY)xxD motif